VFVCVCVFVWRGWLHVGGGYRMMSARASCKRMSKMAAACNTVCPCGCSVRYRVCVCVCVHVYVCKCVCMCVYLCYGVDCNAVVVVRLKTNAWSRAFYVFFGGLSLSQALLGYTHPRAKRMLKLMCGWRYRRALSQMTTSCQRFP